MTREEQRKQVICSCIAMQEQIANVARQEMESAQQQSNDYGANVDRYDSYRTKMMRSRDMYARQLSNAQAGIRVLQDLLRLPPFDSVEHHQRFLLAIGAGKFQLGPHVWFAISAQTPIYIALKGKRIGDSLVFNGQSQTIKEIF